MITIFTVGEERYEYVLSLDSFRKLQFIYYPILKSRDAYFTRDVGLMHSFTTSYAVYVMQALDHLSKNDSNDLFLLNPLLDLMPTEWLALNSTLEKLKTNTPTIFVSTNHVLLGLFLPKNHVKTSPVLRFLTFSNFAVDTLLIKNEWESAQIEVIPIAPNRFVRDDFYIKSDSLLVELQATHYLQACLNNRGVSPKIVGISPYHAGDVLFCSLALTDTQSQIQCIAVNACYADIAAKVLSSSQIIKLDCDPPRRAGNAQLEETKHYNDEILYFYYEIYPRIDKNMGFYYMRNWRHYDESDFHLIDQCRNSLVIGKQPLIHQKIHDGINETIARKKSILLHFDAGWDLKIYPKDYQSSLIRKLKEADYFVTVLTDKEPIEGSDAIVKFESVDQLEGLAKNHSLVVGMDSFPAHYATHCLHHPTITLFSSTIPPNSDQASSRRYKSLQQGLGCNPCRHIEKCPINQANRCINFSPPEVVMTEIDKMYKQNYAQFE